jgi:hypothetical protein
MIESKRNGMEGVDYGWKSAVGVEQGPPKGYGATLIQRIC